MNLLPLITDNISGLLASIIEFTHTRQRVLTENIHNIHNAEFTPKDLAVTEFAEAMNEALIEHMQNQRLVLRDTDNIKFGANASLQAIPIIDEYASELLEQNKDEYLQLQINKLLENLLNRKIAAELLRQKQAAALSSHHAIDKSATGQFRPKFVPLYWDKTQY